MAYVAYHNAELMGGPLEDGPPFGMLSRKASKHLQGNIVWVIEGTGKKKVYTIRHRFRVDSVDEIDDDHFRYEFYGETGLNISPGIVIPEKAWRKDFLKSVGNFGIGVAKLQDEFEEHFNNLVGIDSSIDEIPEDYEYVEGEIKETIIAYRTRSADARAACIAGLGSRCVCCDYDFGEVFGHACHGFIEVHHKQKLSNAGGARKVDPLVDLVPICPNCHRAIHILDCSPEDLTEIIRKRKVGG